MRQPTIVLAAITCLGVLWPVSTPVSAQKRCDDEQAAVDAAQANVDAASRAERRLQEQVALEEELKAAATRAIEENRPAEQSAKNAWDGAVARYNACLNRPRNNECSAEKAAVETATDKLNAAVAVRKKFENTIKNATEALAKLQDDLTAAKEASAAARDKLDKAREKLNRCRCKKWKGGWHCLVAGSYEECCLDKGADE
jgi:chromosome segregation ATPase